MKMYCFVNSFVNKTRSTLHDLKAVTFWTKFHLMELNNTFDTQNGIDLLSGMYEVADYCDNEAAMNMNR